MQSSQYQDLTLCVEAALTIMRLSCEQYFTLISVFAAYLFFRQRPPPVARRVIWLNHRVSTIFKKVRTGPMCAMTVLHMYFYCWMMHPSNMCLPLGSGAYGHG